MHDAVVRRTRVTSGHVGIRVNGGSARIESSLIDARDGTNALLVAPVATTAHADVSHVTILGSALAGTYGVRLSATMQARVATADVRDSIIAGAPKALDVFGWAGVASLHLDHVVRAIDGHVSKATADNGQATIDDVSPIVDTPTFVDAGVEPFALVAGSSLVDAGSSTPPAAGESVDLVGAARIADGSGDCTARRDPGAYEAAAVACVAPPAPAPAAPAPAPAPAADHTAPTITTLKVTRAKATFRLSEAAKVTVTIQRKRGRRYVTARRITRHTPRAPAPSPCA